MERFDCVRKKPIETLFRSLAASTMLALTAAIALPAISFADENGVKGTC